MIYKWMFSVVFFLAVLSANAQFRKIPASVTDAFKAKYENASAVEWKDKITSFEADFKLKEKDMKAFFSSKGDWIKTETKYTYNGLPSSVKDGFKKSKYAEMPVQDVTQVDLKDTEVQYKVMVKKNDYNKRNLLFLKSGQLLSDKGAL